MGIFVWFNEGKKCRSTLWSRPVSTICTSEVLPLTTLLGGSLLSPGGSLGETCHPVLKEILGPMTVYWWGSGRNFQTQEDLHPAVSQNWRWEEKWRAHIHIYKHSTLITEWVLSSSLRCLLDLAHVLFHWTWLACVLLFYLMSEILFTCEDKNLWSSIFGNTISLMSFCELLL